METHWMNYVVLGSKDEVCSGGERCYSIKEKRRDLFKQFIRDGMEYIAKNQREL